MPALPLKCLSCLDSMWKLVCSLTKRLITKTWPTFFCSTLSLLFHHELLCQLTIWSHLHWSRRCSRAAPWVVELLPRVQERPPPRDGASWKGNCRIYWRECPCSLSLLWRVSCSSFLCVRCNNHLRKYLTPGSLTSWAGCLSTHPAFLDKGAMRWCQYNWEVVSSKKTSL